MQCKDYLETVRRVALPVFVNFWLLSFADVQALYRCRAWGFLKKIAPVIGGKVFIIFFTDAIIFTDRTIGGAERRQALVNRFKIFWRILEMGAVQTNVF